MPYIPQSRRERVDDLAPDHVGDLTYAIYKLCRAYPSLHFQDKAEVIAALECAKLEYYRRHVAPYEDQKIEENGDV